MGTGHARFWVLLALLSILVELLQGPRPMGEWWQSASVAEQSSADKQAGSSLVVLVVTDGDGDGEEDGESDEPPGEDPDGKPGESSDEPTGEEGDEQPGKKHADSAYLSASHSYSFWGQPSGLPRLGPSSKLSDLTYHETPERPPRSA